MKNAYWFRFGQVAAALVYSIGIALILACLAVGAITLIGAAIHG